MEKELISEQTSVKQPKTSVPKNGANGKPSVRTASDKQFRKAQAKTSKTHAGLFRRLAQ